MTDPKASNIRPAHAFARLGLIALGVAVVLAAVGYWPTVRLAGAEAVEAMLLGIGIALVGAWAGSLATCLYFAKPPAQHPIGILAGLVVRFVVTIGLTVAAWAADAFDNNPLLIWVGLAQLVILGVDVTGMAGFLRRAAEETA